MTFHNWQPSATGEMLRLRAQLNRLIRDFFYRRQVVEVETPLLAQYPVSDPYIECLSVLHQGQNYYLQSSPEYAMKRMLAAGVGDIYSLSKVFRAGENGRRHNVEFTMLEWYREGFDDHQLMAELEALIKELWVLGGALKGAAESTSLTINYKSYRDVFLEHLGIDPHQASLESLQQCVDQHLEMGSYRCEDVSTALDVLISQYIEPKLPKGLLFIYDYPACQAALARVVDDETGQAVARRFEVFINGMELANGYWELQDAKEQRRRFVADNVQRIESGLPQVGIDERLLAAMEAGLPSCAGVALGVDRLLLQLSGAKSITEVLSFAWSKA